MSPSPMEMNINVEKELLNKNEVVKKKVPQCGGLGKAGWS